MVVVYSNYLDEEAARIVAQVLNDRIMYTTDFVLDKVTDNRIILIGGEVINPNVKFLVDNGYIIGIHQLKDLVGYEPCAIMRCVYNGKEIYVIAGWEAEHTKWVAYTIKLYGSLPTLEYFVNYHPLLSADIASRGIRFAHTIHFKLYNLPFEVKVEFERPVSYTDAKNVLDKLTIELQNRKFLIYNQAYSSVQGGVDAVYVSGEADYYTILEYYNKVKGTSLLAIPLFVWIAVTAFIIAAGIYLVTIGIKEVLFIAYGGALEEIRYREMQSLFDYCKANNVPPDLCLNALNRSIDYWKSVEEGKTIQTTILYIAGGIALSGIGLYLFKKALERKEQKG